MSAVLLAIKPGVTIGAGVTVSVPVAPPPPQYSISFNGSTSYVDVGGTTTDWGLQVSYTIEWWSKASGASGPGTIYSVMCQAPDVNRFDIYYQNGKLYVNNGRELCNEPTPGVWTHVALVCTGGGDGSGGNGLFVYYNGVNVYTGGGYYANDTTNDLWVGRRGNNNFQYFNGKLANIRISNVPRYSTTFTPPLDLELGPYTVLAVNGDLVDLSFRAHTITDNGTSVDTDFPT